MERQEMFDKMVTHLRIQKIRSVDVSGICRYRLKRTAAHAELKCAVGCLIPDDMYERDMDSEGVIRKLFRSYPKVSELLGGEANIEFLTDMQFIHDKESNNEKWESLWKELAENYNLIYTPLKEN